MTVSRKFCRDIQTVAVCDASCSGHFCRVWDNQPGSPRTVRKDELEALKMITAAALLYRVNRRLGRQAIVKALEDFDQALGRQHHQAALEAIDEYRRDHPIKAPSS